MSAPHIAARDAARDRQLALGASPLLALIAVSVTLWLIGLGLAVLVLGTIAGTDEPMPYAVPGYYEDECEEQAP